MFEQRVAALLEKHLGKYILGFRKEDLKLGIWNGDLCLRGLKLRPDCLDGLHTLPLSICDGYIGELHIAIPWRHLSSKPVVFHAKSLHLTVVPLRGEEWNPERERLAERVSKQRRLADLEERKLKRQQKAKEESESKGGRSMLDRLVDRVLANLQFIIEDVHIRYMDVVSDRLSPFVAGLQLERFVITSTDENWKQTMVNELGELQYIHKVVSIEGLAVYLDRLEPAENLYQQTHEISQDAYASSEHTYLLHPASASCRIQARYKAPWKEDIPQYRVEVQFGSVGINVCEFQMNSTYRTLMYFERCPQLKRFRKFRPPLSQTPTSHPKAWWAYAIRSTIHVLRERTVAVATAVDHSKYRKEYVNVFLAQKDAARLQALEDILPYDTIVAFRTAAEVERKRRAILQKKQSQKSKVEKPKEAVNASTSWGWSGWFSSWSSQPTSTDAAAASTTDSDVSLGDLGTLLLEQQDVIPEEEGDLFVLDNDKDSALPLSYCRVFVAARVDKFSIGIRDLSLAEVGSVSFSELDTCLKLFPRDAFAVDASLSSFQIQDADPSSVFPYIYSQRRSAKAEQYEDGRLLVVNFTQPHKPKAGEAAKDAVCPLLRVRGASVDVTLSPYFIRRLIDVFAPPLDVELQQMVTKAKPVPSVGGTGMQLADVHQELPLDIDITIPMPRLIVPQRWREDSTPLFVFYLGTTRIRTAKAANSPKAIEIQTDQLSIEAPPVRSSLNDAVGSHTLLEPFDVHVSINTSGTNPDISMDAEFSAWKLHASKGRFDDFFQTLATTLQYTLVKHPEEEEMLGEHRAMPLQVASVRAATPVPARGSAGNDSDSDDSDEFFDALEEAVDPDSYVDVDGNEHLDLAQLIEGHANGNPMSEEQYIAEFVCDDDAEQRRKYSHTADHVEFRLRAKTPGLTIKLDTVENISGLSHGNPATAIILNVSNVGFTLNERKFDRSVDVTMESLLVSAERPVPGPSTAGMCYIHMVQGLQESTGTGFLQVNVSQFKPKSPAYAAVEMKTFVRCLPIMVFLHEETLAPFLKTVLVVTDGLEVLDEMDIVPSLLANSCFDRLESIGFTHCIHPRSASPYSSCSSSTVSPVPWSGAHVAGMPHRKKLGPVTDSSGRMLIKKQTVVHVSGLNIRCHEQPKWSISMNNAVPTDTPLCCLAVGDFRLTHEQTSYVSHLKLQMGRGLHGEDGDGVEILQVISGDNGGTGRDRYLIELEMLSKLPEAERVSDIDEQLRKHFPVYDRCMKQMAIPGAELPGVPLEVAQSVVGNQSKYYKRVMWVEVASISLVYVRPYIQSLMHFIDRTRIVASVTEEGSPTSSPRHVPRSRRGSRTLPRPPMLLSAGEATSSDPVLPEGVDPLFIYAHIESPHIRAPLHATSRDRRYVEAQLGNVKLCTRMCLKGSLAWKELYSISVEDICLNTFEKERLFLASKVQVAYRSTAVPDAKLNASEVWVSSAGELSLNFSNRDYCTVLNTVYDNLDVESYSDSANDDLHSQFRPGEPVQPSNAAKAEIPSCLTVSVVLPRMDCHMSEGDSPLLSARLSDATFSQESGPENTSMKLCIRDLTVLDADSNHILSHIDDCRLRTAHVVNGQQQPPTPSARTGDNSSGEATPGSAGGPNFIEVLRSSSSNGCMSDTRVLLQSPCVCVNEELVFHLGGFFEYFPLEDLDDDDGDSDNDESFFDSEAGGAADNYDSVILEVSKDGDLVLSGKDTLQLRSDLHLVPHVRRLLVDAPPKSGSVIIDGCGKTVHLYIHQDDVLPVIFVSPQTDELTFRNLSFRIHHPKLKRAKGKHLAEQVAHFQHLRISDFVHCSSKKCQIVAREAENVFFNVSPIFSTTHSRMHSRRGTMRQRSRTRMAALDAAKEFTDKHMYGVRILNGIIATPVCVGAKDGAAAMTPATVATDWLCVGVSCSAQYYQRQSPVADESGWGIRSDNLQVFMTSASAPRPIDHIGRFPLDRESFNLYTMTAVNTRQTFVSDDGNAERIEDLQSSMVNYLIRPTSLSAECREKCPRASSTASLRSSQRVLERVIDINCGLMTGRFGWIEVYACKNVYEQWFVAPQDRITTEDLQQLESDIIVMESGGSDDPVVMSAIKGTVNQMAFVFVDSETGYDRPLACILLTEPMSVRIQTKPELTAIALPSIPIAIDTFVQPFARWEPILEPVNLRVECRMTGSGAGAKSPADALDDPLNTSNGAASAASDASPSPAAPTSDSDRMSVLVSAVTPFNVNFTPHSMRAIRSLLYLLEASEDPSSRYGHGLVKGLLRNTRSPYVLINQCGWPIRLSVPDDENVEGSVRGSSVHAVVPDGSQMPFGHPLYDTTVGAYGRLTAYLDTTGPGEEGMGYHSHTKKFAEKNLTIELQILRDGMFIEPLLRVPLNCDGSQMVTIKSGDKRRERVLCRVEHDSKRGQRTVRVSSSMFFFNSCKRPLRIVLEESFGTGASKSGGHQVICERLTYGESGSVPLFASSIARLAVYMYKSPDSEEVFPVPAYLNLDQLPTIAAACKDDSGRPCVLPIVRDGGVDNFIQAYIERIPSGVLGSTFGVDSVNGKDDDLFLRLVFSPPLQVSNLLPYSFAYRLVQVEYRGTNWKWDTELATIKRKGIGSSSRKTQRSGSSGTGSGTGGDDSLVDEIETTVAAGALHPGEDLSVYSTNPNTFVYLRIRPLGDGWRERWSSVLVSIDRDAAQQMKLSIPQRPKSLDLHDSSNGSVSVGLENFRTRYQTRTLKLFCTHWIIAQSELPLWFGDTHKRLLPGQSTPDAPSSSLSSSPSRRSPQEETTTTASLAECVDVESYDPDDGVLAQLPSVKPITVTSPETYRDVKTRICMRTRTTEWSSLFNIDGIGNGMVVIEESSKRSAAVDRRLMFSVHILDGPGRWRHRTRIIIVDSLVTIHNNIRGSGSLPLVIRQPPASSYLKSAARDVPEANYVRMMPNESAVFNWPDKTRRSRMQLALHMQHGSEKAASTSKDDNDELLWSPWFTIGSLGDQYVRIPLSRTDSNAVYCVNVHVTQNAIGQLSVAFREEGRLPPYVILNETWFRVQIRPITAADRKKRKLSLLSRMKKKKHGASLSSSALSPSNPKDSAKQQQQQFGTPSRSSDTTDVESEMDDDDEDMDTELGEDDIIDDLSSIFIASDAESDSETITSGGASEVPSDERAAEEELKWQAVQRQSELPLVWPEARARTHVVMVRVQPSSGSAIGSYGQSEQSHLLVNCDVIGEVKTLQIPIRKRKAVTPSASSLSSPLVPSSPVRPTSVSFAPGSPCAPSSTCSVDDDDDESNVEWIDVLISVETDGPTKVLCIRDRVVADSSVSRRLAMDRTQALKSADSSVLATSRGAMEVPRWALQISLEEVGISLVEQALHVMDRRASRELLYMLFKGLSLEHVVSEHGYETFEFVLRYMQIDNQLTLTAFPVLFAPRLPRPAKSTSSAGSESKSNGGDEAPAKPFIHVAYLRHGSASNTDTASRMLNGIREKSSVSMFQYMSFCMQEADINVDEELLYPLLYAIDDLIGALVVTHKHTVREIEWDTVAMTLYQRASPQLKEPKQQHSATATESSASLTSAASSSSSAVIDERIHIEDLELHPLKLNFSFLSSESRAIGALEGDSPSPASSSSTSAAGGSASAKEIGALDDEAALYVGQSGDSGATVILTLLDRLWPMLKNIDSAPIECNSLILKDVFDTQTQLQQKVVQHYQRALAVQVLKAVGSFDLLGNPVGLFRNVSSGIVSLFYEPIHAMTRSPKDVGHGLIRGASFFFRSAAHGLLNTTSKVAGAISKGLAATSMDPSYLRARAEEARRGGPKNANEGLARGSKALGGGVYHAVAGLMREPVRGAQDGGMSGFLKGFGRAVVGVATKPAAGLLDFASITSAGIRSSASGGSTARNEGIRVTVRFRPPRPFPESGRLLVYSRRHAEGWELLCTMKNGAFARDQFLAYFTLAYEAPPGKTDGSTKATGAKASGTLGSSGSTSSMSSASGNAGRKGGANELYEPHSVIITHRHVHFVRIRGRHVISTLPLPTIRHVTVQENALQVTYLQLDPKSIYDTDTSTVVTIPTGSPVIAQQLYTTLFSVRRRFAALYTAVVRK